MSRRKPDNTKPTTRDVNAAARAQLALKLRAQRLSWDQVALEAGYSSRGAAHHAVMRELSRNISANVEEMRREELATLDFLQAEITMLFINPTNKGRLFAVDRILAIMERRARLCGLDAKQDGLPPGVTIVREYGVEVGKV